MMASDVREQSILPIAGKVQALSIALRLHCIVDVSTVRCRAAFAGGRSIMPMTTPGAPGTFQNGSRGIAVARLQDMLNCMKPTTLSLLKDDGVFGAKTETRVREFQRLRGIGVNGTIDRATLNLLTVGPATISAIGARFRTNLFRFNSNAASFAAFDRDFQRSENAIETAVPLVIVGAVVVLFFAMCAAIIAMSANAQTPEAKRNADRLGRIVADEVDAIRDAMVDNKPSVLMNKVMDSIRKMVRDSTKMLLELRDKCQDEHPVATRTPACAVALAGVGTLLSQLNEKLARLPGGSLSVNIDTEVLIGAVLLTYRTLFVAMSTIGRECVCPFMEFL